jgi:hypothetical protein
MDGFPGFRVGGTFGPDNPAGFCAGGGEEAHGQGKERFGVHGQAVLFPKPKMAKKKERTNRLTHFVYANTQIFVYPWSFVSNFANNKVCKGFNFKNFKKHA